jgi:hypothetical protein
VTAAVKIFVFRLGTTIHEEQTRSAFVNRFVRTGTREQWCLNSHKVTKLPWLRLR